MVYNLDIGTILDHEFLMDRRSELDEYFEEIR